MTKRKKDPRPVHFKIKRLIDPATGEEIGALVPLHGIDKRLMRERAYRVGDELRADLKKPRNPKFFRLVHSLGALVADHIEAFHGMDCHAAIKRLQRESGICCEEQEVEIPNLGKLVIKVASSISFESMDEGAFHQFWRGICQHIIATYWHGIEQQRIDEMVGLMPEAA